MKKVFTSTAVVFSMDSSNILFLIVEVWLKIQNKYYAHKHDEFQWLGIRQQDMQKVC